MRFQSLLLWLGRKSCTWGSRTKQITTDGSQQIPTGKRANTNPPVRIPASAAAARSLFAGGAGGGRTQRGGRRRGRRGVPGGRSALWTGTRRPKLLHTNHSGVLERKAGVMIVKAKTLTALQEVDPQSPSGFVLNFPRKTPNLRSAHKGNFCYCSNFNGDNAAATPKEMHPLFSPFRSQRTLKRSIKLSVQLSRAWNHFILPLNLVPMAVVLMERAAPATGRRSAAPRGCTFGLTY